MTFSHTRGDWWGAVATRRYSGKRSSVAFDAISVRR